MGEAADPEALLAGLSDVSNLAGLKVTTGTLLDQLVAVVLC